jgi:hypothetical protein
MWRREYSREELLGQSTITNCGIQYLEMSQPLG